MLDPLHPDDAAEMAGVLGDARLHEFTGGRPLTRGELRRRFQRLALGRSANGRETWLNWIIRLQAGRAAVGTVQATVHDDDTHRNATIAWVIGVPWQRQGIAGEAAIALVGWLEDQGIRDISACIHPRHVASQKVAARAGLVRTDEVVGGEERWRRPVGA